MTTVIGIFDNDSDLEVALNRLYDKGFNDVRVVDRSREQDTTNIPAGAFVPGAPNGATSQTAPNAIYPGAFIVPGFFNLENDVINSDYLMTNLDMPMSDEEANFYSNAVRNGGRLLIVDTDDDHTDMVWSVMRNSNASQYTRPENT